jgi:hypothetical protein
MEAWKHRFGKSELTKYWKIDRLFEKVDEFYVENVLEATGILVLLHCHD